MQGIAPNPQYLRHGIGTPISVTLSPSAAPHATISSTTIESPMENREGQQVLRAIFADSEKSNQLLGKIRLFILKAGFADKSEVSEITLDLLGELYMEAMDSADRYDPRRGGIAWLLGISHNLVMRKREEYWRQGRERKMSDLIEPLTGDAKGDADIFDRLVAAGLHGNGLDPIGTPELTPAQRDATRLNSPLERTHTLEEILSLVSLEDQNLLRLAVIEQMNGERLAAQLSVKPDTARQRLHRAMNRLRQAYVTTFQSPSNLTEIATTGLHGNPTVDLRGGGVLAPQETKGDQGQVLLPEEHPPLDGECINQNSLPDTVMPPKQ